MNQQSVITSPTRENFSVVTVTPKLASEWLARNTHNRELSQPWVRWLAEQMTGGTFEMTYDPIRFSESGRLLDGQHRLSAICASGVTVNALVVEGLPDRIFDKIDIGKKRSGVDILVIAGLEPRISRIAAPAAVLALRYEAGFPPVGGEISNAQVNVFVARTPAFLTTCEFVAEMNGIGRPLQRSLAAFLHYEMSKKESALADEFIVKLMTGADLAGTDIVLALREKFLRASITQEKMPRLRQLAGCILVWNSLRAGRAIKHISNAFRAGDFPEIK